MKQLYKTIFHLGNREKKPALEEIVAETCKWVEKKHHLILQPGLINQEVHSQINSAQSLFAEESGTSTEPSKRYYGLIYHQQDLKQRDRSWEVTLAAKDDGISDPLIEVLLSTETISDSIKPEELKLAGPNLVPLLIDQFGANLNGPLTTQPLRANSGNIKNIVNLINDPNRVLPVLFISAKNETDKPIINQDAVAKSVSGLAHVFSAEQREYYLKTQELLGERSAYNGAIRLYWPSKVTSYSPIWIPKAFNQKRIELFDKEILNFLARLSISRSSPVNIGQIERIILGQQLKKMAEDGDWKKLAEVYATENQDLMEEKRKLEGVNEFYSEKITSYELQIDGLRQSIIELEKQKSSKEKPTEVESKRVIDSMQTALDAFQGLESRVIIASKAERSIRKSPYENPEQFFQALQWLSGEYIDVKTGVKKGNLNDLSRTACGMQYCPRQSEVTMGEHPEDYFIVHDGRKYCIEEHLKKGTGREEETNLRIGFDFDKELTRVIIGYIGVHQQNRLT